VNLSSVDEASSVYQVCFAFWFLTSSSWVNHSSVDAAFEHYCTDFGIDTSSALYVSCLVASKAGFGIDYVSTWLLASTLSF
jgi:hypothetical protein